MAEDSNKKWHKIKEDHDLEELESEFQNEGFDDNDYDEDEMKELHKKAGKAKSSKNKHHDPELGHLDYKELEEKLTLAEQESHKNWEKATRALAELENVRRRSEREVANAHRYGIDKLLTSLFPVVDSLEQAMQVAEAGSQMAEGLDLTMKLFLGALEKQGVHQLNPLGEPFNPQEHEAMSMQQTTEQDPNTVLMVFQKGYKLHDRIVRPARVVVAKGSS